MISTDEHVAATARAAELRATTPHAVTARFDRKAERVVLTLSSKVELMFSPKDAQGLEDATPAELSTIQISPSGFGIHFPKLDADLSGSPRSSKASSARASGWPPASVLRAANPAAPAKPPPPALTEPSVAAPAGLRQSGPS